jgi:NADP-dependent 3-hydroxy acid dehydrogenase YdfG
MTRSTVSRKVVAITGGARGIGLATAKAFLAQGAKVSIGDRDVDEVKRAAERLEGEVTALPLDVTSKDSFAAYLDGTEDAFGPLDVLVNNAGVMLTGEFIAESMIAEATMVDVNLRGVILGCKLASARFVRQGSGQIVNIASMAGIAGFPGVATYSATKFGVVGLTLALRQELRPYGVHVGAILPGVVHTDLSAGIQLPGVVERFVSVEPDAIAQAVVAITRRGAAMAYVPRRLRPALRTMLSMPERPRRLLARLTRTEHVYLAVDYGTRVRYHERVAETNRN